MLKKDPTKAKPSEVRVRENLQNTLTRKFVDLAKDYQNRQVPQMRAKQTWQEAAFEIDPLTRQQFLLSLTDT